MAIDYTKKPKQPDPAETGSGPSLTKPTPTKVTLTKAAPTVSLTKTGPSGGTLRVNLNWNARPAAPAEAASGGGLLKRLAKAAGAGAGGAIDLDLGCLYEFTDGSKGVVQALGGALRDKGSSGAICWLDGDDRSGTNKDGENLYVDLARVGEIKRIVVFAFIYGGVPNWAAADAVVTLHPPTGPQVEVRLDEARAGAGMCGIAMLESARGELAVRREVQYVRGHRDLDKAYGWGLRWAAGAK